MGLDGWKGLLKVTIVNLLVSGCRVSVSGTRWTFQVCVRVASLHQKSLLVTTTAAAHQHIHTILDKTAHPQSECSPFLLRGGGLFGLEHL